MKIGRRCKNAGCRTFSYRTEQACVYSIERDMSVSALPGSNNV